MSTPVQVIVLHQDVAPVLATLMPDPDRDGHLKAMQAVVGGYVELLGDFDGRGTDLWCNEEGLINGLPLNRSIPVAPDAVWHIHGDFLIARRTEDGDLASVTEEDVTYYEDLFARIDAMKAMKEAVLLLGKRPEVIARGECMPTPIGCGGPKGEFKDEISEKEYQITGLCQACQDRLYDALAADGVEVEPLREAIVEQVEEGD